MVEHIGTKRMTFDGTVWACSSKGFNQGRNQGAKPPWKFFAPRGKMFLDIVQIYWT